MTHDVMTEADKKVWLDGQIRKCGLVFCPWCSGINNPGDEATPCCRAFSLAIQDRADEMVRSFANQYTAIECGLSSSITCPYCRSVNRAPGPVHPADWKRPMINPFCCDQFCHALAARLEVKRVNGLVRMADKIAERLDKAGAN